MAFSAPTGSPLFGVMLKPFLLVAFRDTAEIVDR